MAPFSYDSHSCSVTVTLVLFLIIRVVSVSGATFTFVNKCDYTVWPGILGKPDLGSTGFELGNGTSHSFQAPAGWSGRFWGRTGCSFDDFGKGTCATADCGTSSKDCSGNGATPPATLAEFTLGSNSPDYYDVSLVDGYNLPMMIEGRGGSGMCATTGCSTDLNLKCPNELRVDGGDACKSACDAFNKPEYCCSGAYSSPSSCKPSIYSQMFKSACPKSYSYAFDDATSTFTCTGADYTITFCPSSPSLKSSKDSPPKSSGTEGSDSGSGSGSGSDQEIEQAALTSNSWLANLATGASTTRTRPSEVSSSGFLIFILFFILF